MVLAWVDASSVATPAGSAVTKSNGSYAAALTAPAVAGAYTLRATVQGPVIRKVGSKKKGKKNKKGRRFSCNASLPTSTGPLTVTPGV